MKTFDELSDQDWRILVDEFDINEPMICYPDPHVGGRYVGPLAKVSVGATVENDDGDECLDLESDDGRNLFAIACLPQLAELCRWIESEYQRLGVSENSEYNAFVDELKSRVEWIRQCVDERDMEVSVESGSIGFGRFRPSDT